MLEDTMLHILGCCECISSEKETLKVFTRANKRIENEQ